MTCTLDLWLYAVESKGFISYNPSNKGVTPRFRVFCTFLSAKRQENDAGCAKESLKKRAARESPQRAAQPPC
jgi:hypothetical protein